MNVRPNRAVFVTPELAAQMASGTDADLLAIIGQDRNREREWAEAALFELHRRHADFLFGVCRRISIHYLADPNQTEPLLSRTVLRVFETAERFVPSKTGCGNDADCLCSVVRAWMARKVRWLAKDVVRGPGHISVSSVEPEALDQIGTEDDEPAECSDEVMSAINRLPERERHVILASFFFADGRSDRPVPPDEAVDAYLARRWGTTAPNIRQIRRRALETLRGWLSSASVRPSALR